MSARAVLRLDLEGGADIARALGQIKGVVRAAQAGMNAESRRGSTERTRIATAEGRAVAAAAREGERARVRSEREASRAVASEARKRDQSAKASARERERAEKAVTRTTETEARKRTTAEARAGREVETIAKRSAAARERAERDVTRAAEREGRNRTRISERNRAAMGRGLATVGRAGMQYAGQMHGDIQDSRQRRAASEHTINSALYQVGVGGAEAQGMRSQIYARARALGMDSGELSAGLAASQTQFNTLSGATPQARQAALNSQLDLADLAQSTYQSPAEVMRLAGMLGQQGITGTDQRRTIMTMTGMAQAGSIELGSMTREALGPLMQNIARSVSAGMSPAERSAAVRSATIETMAVGEVSAAAGGRSRDSLNALAKTRGTIADPRMQERLYARLSGAGHNDLAAQMFSTTNGQHRLRSQNAVGFMSQLVTGLGGSQNATTLLGSGGPGQPMVLDSQQRRLLLLLASQSASGGTVASRVNALQTQGEAFDEGDVARGRAMVQGEQGTTIQRAQELHDSTLTDNTSAVVGLSSTIRDWSVRNPWIAGAGNAVGSVASAALPAALARGAPGLLGRTAARLGLAAGGAGFGATVATALGGFFGGGAIGEGINRLSYSDAQRRQSTTGGDTSILSGTTWQGAAHGVRDLASGAVPLTAEGIAGALVAALRVTPLTAAIGAHDAAHASTLAASGRNPAPPASR